jgi:hypothetical protein
MQPDPRPAQPPEYAGGTSPRTAPDAQQSHPGA